MSGFVALNLSGLHRGYASNSTETNPPKTEKRTILFAAKRRNPEKMRDFQMKQCESGCICLSVRWGKIVFPFADSTKIVPPIPKSGYPVMTYE
jgi:hypothetical protein